MKKITEAVNKANLEIPKDSMNYISADDLKKYLEVTEKFISEETKELINWLIVNNDTYISNMSNNEDENTLTEFYKTGIPK